MINNDLFICISDQLKYHVDGTSDKFNEIFEKACELYDISFDSGYMSYIYSDFLNMIGLIEKYRRQGRERWRVLECPRNAREIRRVEFRSNHDFKLFPDFSLFSCYIGEVEAWQSLVLKKNLAFDSFVKLNIRTVNVENIESRYTKKYNFSKNIWENVEFNAEEEGIYLVGYHSFQREPLVNLGNKSFYVYDLDYIFLIYLIINQNKTPFQLTNNELLIPWKMKLPGIIKRLFFSLSKSVHYDYKGVRFLFEDMEPFESFVDVLFEEKIKIGDMFESR